MAGRAKKTQKKPYLQWSKKQSGVVIGFFIVYYIFLALCIVYSPDSAEWLVKLGMYVAFVMIANLGFYNGNSVLEKINGNKLLENDSEDENG